MPEGKALHCIRLQIHSPDKLNLFPSPGNEGGCVLVGARALIASCRQGLQVTHIELFGGVPALIVLATTKAHCAVIKQTTKLFVEFFSLLFRHVLVAAEVSCTCRTTSSRPAE